MSRATVSSGADEADPEQGPDGRLARSGSKSFRRLLPPVAASAISRFVVLAVLYVAPYSTLPTAVQASFSIETGAPTCILPVTLHFIPPAVGI